VDLIAILARWRESSENDGHDTLFDLDAVAQVKLCFVAAAYNDLAWSFQFGF
jgi:hypothetical protein